MAFDGLTIHALVTELKEKIIDGKIDKISQGEKDEILLNIRNNGENTKLMISASNSFPRIYADPLYKKENPLQAPMFLMMLRKHIQGGVVKDISQYGLDRCVYIDIESYDELRNLTTKTLAVEIMGKHSNIILVQKEDQKIIDSIKRIPLSVSSVRQVLPGMKYSLPPAQEKLSPLEDIAFEEFSSSILNNIGPIYKRIYMSFSGISPVIAKEICFRANIRHNTVNTDLKPIEMERLYNSFCRMMECCKNNDYQNVMIIDEQKDQPIEFSCFYLTMYNDHKVVSYDSTNQLCCTYYREKDLKDRLHQKSQNIRKTIGNNISKLKNKLEKQTQELNETIEMDALKRKGDLLTANIYRMQDNMKSITVQDFYQEDMPEITIELDENKTASKIIQDTYKRYNKLKSRKKELHTQIEKTKHEIQYLENVEFSIENARTTEDIKQISMELHSEGYIRSTENKKGKKKHQEKIHNEPLHFKSSDGFDIYVGKNNVQNDYLTLKFASNNDLWLHTKDIPGSHVIVKSYGNDIPESTIVEAATIAAYHSKGVYSSNVPIDYTLRKNVKKPSGAKAGMVIYVNNSTIYVTPSKKLVEELKCLEDGKTQG